MYGKGLGLYLSCEVPRNVFDIRMEYSRSNLPRSTLPRLGHMVTDMLVLPHQSNMPHVTYYCCIPPRAQFPLSYLLSSLKTSIIHVDRAVLNCPFRLCFRLHIVSNHPDRGERERAE